MKVLMINDFRSIGGAESHVDTLISGLHKLGVQVKLWIAEEHKEDAGNWRQELKTYQPDILHVHNWALLLKYDAVEGLFDTVPTVMSLHDYLLICYKRMRLHNWRNCPDPCNDACGLAYHSPELLKLTEKAIKVCFNPGSSDLFTQAGVHTIMIPHGIDIDKWPPDYSTKTKVGFSCAHPAYWWKGAAIAETLLKDLGITDYEILQGGKNQQQVSQFYRSLELLVLPTMYDEPFCLVITEAMASGVVVVSYDNTGATFQIEHGYNGYLTPKNDYSALKETVNSILGQNNEAIKRFARKRVEANFDSRIMVMEYKQLYEGLL